MSIVAIGLWLALVIGGFIASKIQDKGAPNED